MRVLEVFEAHQTAYYVKEYLDEGSLAESLAHRSHFCTEETLFFVQRICAALDVLHQNKMQHLDLKPSNILLGGVEQVVLTDFGLSKHRLSDGMLEASTDIGRGASDYAPLEQGLCGEMMCSVQRSMFIRLERFFISYLRGFRLWMRCTY